MGTFGSFKVHVTPQFIGAQIAEMEFASGHTFMGDTAFETEILQPENMICPKPSISICMTCSTEGGTHPDLAQLIQKIAVVDENHRPPMPSVAAASRLLGRLHRKEVGKERVFTCFFGFEHLKVLKRSSHLIQLTMTSNLCEKRNCNGCVAKLHGLVVVFLGCRCVRVST